MATFAFSGGVLPVKGAGQKSKIRFGGTWASAETWTAAFTSQLTGNFTLGKGNIAGLTFASLLSFKERAIVGYNGGFAISAVDNPTGWEEQDIGSATFAFSTSYGVQDTAHSFSHSVGKLFVFGEKSIQSWATDADPTKWVLTQILDNAGTVYTSSVQALGDVDVYYVDRSGVRSIQTKELTGDAFVGDIGSPIDLLVQSKLKLAQDAGTALVSCIDPLNKNYLVWIYDSFFVYAKYPVSRIAAWSRYDGTWTDVLGAISGSGTFNAGGTATIGGLTMGQVYVWRTSGSNTTSLVNGTETLTYQTQFTAQGTSVTLNGIPLASVFDILIPIKTFLPVSLISGTNKSYVFGNDNWLYFHWLNETSEADFSLAHAETPWLEINDGKMCQLESLEVVCVGQWSIEYSTNPRTETYATAIVTPAQTVPTTENSSSSDMRRYAISGNSSRIKLRLKSADIVNEPTLGQVNQPRMCSLSVIYKPSNEK